MDDTMGMLGGMGEAPGGMDKDKLKEILMMLLDLFIAQGGDASQLMMGTPGATTGGMPPMGAPSGSKW